MDYKERFKIRTKLNKLYRGFIRDKWGNLTKCYWNQITKKDILKHETFLRESRII